MSLTQATDGETASIDATAAVLWIAAIRLAIHCATNYQYGFHRDELAILDDARFLDWGYVAYPPFTPLIARVARELFGTSLVGLRFFAALAQAIVLVLTAKMAKALGGRRESQILAAVMVCAAPISLASGALFEYVSFDYLWWVVTAYAAVRLLETENPRWWLTIGAAIGMGMLTKYTMVFLAAGVAIGTVFTPARRYLRSPWLWAGAAIAILLPLPNVIWQARHGFISLEMLSSIHERDVRIGRTANFLPHQFLVGANPFTIPFWIVGLWFCFRGQGRRFQMIGWMYLVPLLLFVIAQGRDYYLAPAYPMLLAAGAVAAERRWQRRPAALPRVTRRLSWVGASLGGLIAASVVLPIAPVNSLWWRFAVSQNGDLREEIGWPELVKQVAEIRDRLPDKDKERLGILTGNYGEVGALHLYGPAYHLPDAISPVNTHWLRGYTQPPPETLIVLGWSKIGLRAAFSSCQEVGQPSNAFGIKNEETEGPPIHVCRGLLRPWPEFWAWARHFG